MKNKFCIFLLKTLTNPFCCTFMTTKISYQRVLATNRRIHWMLLILNWLFEFVCHQHNSNLFLFQNLKYSRIIYFSKFFINFFESGVKSSQSMSSVDVKIADLRDKLWEEDVTFQHSRRLFEAIISHFVKISRIQTLSIVMSWIVSRNFLSHL